MHPRERPTTRRQFLIRAGAVVGTLSGADALLSACGGSAKSGAVVPPTTGTLLGPGGIPLARASHPVTLKRWEDPIASGLKPETGGTTYCLEAVVGTHKAVVNGPGGTVIQDNSTAPAFADCA